MTQKEFGFNPCYNGLLIRTDGHYIVAIGYDKFQSLL